MPLGHSRLPPARLTVKRAVGAQRGPLILLHPCVGQAQAAGDTAKGTGRGPSYGRDHPRALSARLQRRRGHPRSCWTQSTCPRRTGHRGQGRGRGPGERTSPDVAFALPRPPPTGSRDIAAPLAQSFGLPGPQPAWCLAQPPFWLPPPRVTSEDSTHPQRSDPVSLFLRLV